MMSLKGVKRADGRAFTWQDVFPQPGTPATQETPARRAAPSRAPASKVDVLKVFRLWKTGKVQT